jgi:hypothetical protein
MKVSAEELITGKDFPSISIVMPTHPGYPEFKLDKEHMHKVFNQIENKLEKQYSKKQTKAMIEKLNNVVERIDFSKLTEGLAIYVSPNVEKVIHFPFPVSSEKVIVDESFEVRDIIQAIKSCKDSLIVVISQNMVKTFTNIDCEMKQIEFLDMPDGVKDVTNEHSLPGWNYLDTKSWEEKNLHNYLHFIDTTIEKELKRNKFKVIILGDRKLLGYYKKVTRIGDKIIGYIEGNYEHSNFSDLKKLIHPVLENDSKKEIEYAMKLLGEAIDSDNYAAGITQVWRSAMEGRGRLLIVEKDYKQSAIKGDDSFSINVDHEGNNPWNFIADAVDDIMQIVLKNKGDIVFVDNGTLTDYQKIVLINRY